MLTGASDTSAEDLEVHLDTPLSESEPEPTEEPAVESEHEDIKDLTTPSEDGSDDPEEDSQEDPEEPVYEIPRSDPIVEPPVEPAGEDSEEAPFQAELFSTSARDPAVVRAAADLVVGARRASATFLQRRLRVGYDEAIELLDELREEGVVGGAIGDPHGPLLVDPDAWSD